MVLAITILSLCLEYLITLFFSLANSYIYFRTQCRYYLGCETCPNCCGQYSVFFPLNALFTPLLLALTRLRGNWLLL